MSSKYLLGNSAVDGYLLEDGSGVLLLEPSFSTPFSGSINLFIHGFAVKNDNIDLTITGHESLTNNLNLFIDGKDSINDNLTLFISSINVVADTLYLFIHGLDNFSDNLDLFIHGSVAENDNIDLFITGLDSFFETLELFIAGPVLISDNLTLFIVAPVLISNSINLFIKGPTQITDNIDLFLKVPEPINDSFTLFIFGYQESNFTTLFLQTEDNDIATSRPLYIYGSPSGVDLNFAGQGIDLFVKSSITDSIYPPVITGSNFLFLMAESGIESSDGSWSLFLNSDTSINNNIDLYISTNEKSVSSNLDLFIARIPDFPGQEGYTPINVYQTLFLKTQDGAQRDLELSISGSPGPVNDNLDCFIGGLHIINDNLNLVLYGITGDILDNIDLYVYGIDTPIEEIALFIRGY